MYVCIYVYVYIYLYIHICFVTQLISTLVFSIGAGPYGSDVYSDNGWMYKRVVPTAPISGPLLSEVLENCETGQDIYKLMTSSSFHYVLPLDYF